MTDMLQAQTAPAPATMAAPLLNIENLTIAITSRDGSRTITAVNGARLKLHRGRTMGVIGESGCGKSTTVMSIMRLLPPSARFLSGDIDFDGIKIIDLPEREMRALRGTRLALIMQDPMVALDPLFTIGQQMGEMLKLHTNVRGEALRARQIELLQAVGIPSAETRLEQYPHQMSGGMLQRIVTAIALSCDPELLIADEPTTALDPTAQAQVLDMLAELGKKRNLALIIVTHDFGVTARMCDDVTVMYAGRVVESGEIHDIFDRPAHPYTQALLTTVPKGDEARSDRLVVIEGQPPDLSKPVIGCAFAPRCVKAFDRCWHEEPPEIGLGGDHYARCWLAAS